MCLDRRPQQLLVCKQRHACQLFLDKQALGKAWVTPNHLSGNHYEPLERAHQSCGESGMEL